MIASCYISDEFRLGGKLMKKAVIYLLKYFTALLPSVLLVVLLLNYFPYTGLGRIIALPMIFILNTSLITIGLVFTRWLSRFFVSGMWLLIIVSTLVITLFMYPQEFSPNIPTQLWSKITS